MDWLNIHTSTLDSAEFLGANPIERSTWLCLMRFCAGQENGGTINDCSSWSDRKWQQLCRVTKREVSSRCALWTWIGNDISVSFYPIQKEQVVKLNRKNGKAGGRPVSNQPVNHVDIHPVSEIETTRFDSAETERKGKGIGTEEEEEGEKEVAAVSAQLPFSSAEFSAAWTDWLEYRRERRLPAYKTKSAMGVMAKLAAYGEAGAIASLRESIANNWQGLFEPKAGAARSSSETARPELRARF